MRAAPPVESILDAVGGTPLVRLCRVVPSEGAAVSGRARIASALESLARAVGHTPLVRLRRIGADLPGVRIFAKCVAYAWICAALGLRCALVMPRNVSAARKRIARRMAAAGEEGHVVTVLPDRADRYFEPRGWERRISW